MKKSKIYDILTIYYAPLMAGRRCKVCMISAIILCLKFLRNTFFNRKISMQIKLHSNISAIIRVPSSVRITFFWVIVGLFKKKDC